MLRLYVKDVAVQRLYVIVPTHPKFNIQNPKFNINLPHMIKAENICKSYSQLQVLKGINLNIGKGEIVAIVGASGAGKTTLLQILGTLDKADTGTLLLNEQLVNSLNDSKLSDFRNKNIGFIFQFHQLLPEFTAFENVMIPAWIAKTNEAQAKQRALELFDYLGIKDRTTHKPSELSGGEQQRVAVARAIINNPAVLLADEPSGNLDSASAQSLHDLFFDLRDKFNQTIVIVTHNEELANRCDRKLTMKDGLIL
jgi:lipoprotein-releasing system ATP-binding protein